MHQSFYLFFALPVILVDGTSFFQFWRRTPVYQFLNVFIISINMYISRINLIIQTKIMQVYKHKRCFCV